MITSSGKHIQISERRYCKKCKAISEQICHKVRYEENPDQEGTLLKQSYWICSNCITETEELKVQPIPGDKIKIMNRLLRMQDDYDYLNEDRIATEETCDRNNGQELEPVAWHIWVLI